MPPPLAERRAFVDGNDFVLACSGSSVGFPQPGAYPFKLHAVNTQMARCQRMPAVRVHRSEPGVGIAQLCFQTGGRCDRGEERLAGLFVFRNYDRCYLRTGFHPRRAGRARGNSIVGKVADDPRHFQMDNAQVIQRHQHRPIATAVFHPDGAGDEDALCELISIARLYKLTDAFAFPVEFHIDRIAAANEPLNFEYPPPDDQFVFGKSRTGRAKLRFGVCTHGNENVALLAMCK